MTITSGATTEIEPAVGMRVIEPQPATGRRAASSRRLNLAAAGLLLLLAVGFMLPGLLPGRVAAPLDRLMIYSPWNTYYPNPHPLFLGGDLLRQQLPWRHWMQDELGAGRFPLWASGPLGGEPLFASMNPGVLYPLHLLWVMMPVSAGLGIVLMLKLWLTGLGMWGLLRAMQLRAIPAILGAIGLMFSAWVVSWLAWDHTSSYLLMPWLAWAAYEWWHSNRRIGLVGVAVGTGFTIFGGHPETVFIVGAALAVWVIGLVIFHRPSGWLWRLGVLALAAALGAGLGAVQILPFAEALSLSHIYGMRSSSPVSWAVFHLRPEQLTDWVLPRFWAYEPDGVISSCCSFYDSTYVGLVPLLGLPLAVVAAVRRELRWRTLAPWLFMGVFAWVVLYDDALGTLVRSLPGFSTSANSRWAAVVSFAVLVSGSFGWDWLAGMVERRREQREASAGEHTAPGVRRAHAVQKALAAAGAALISTGLLVLAAHLTGIIPTPPMTDPITGTPWWNPDRDYRMHWAVWQTGLSLAALGGMSLWAFGIGRGRRARPGRWPVHRAGPMLLVLVLVVDLFTLGMPLNGSAPASMYYPATSVLQQIRVLVPPTERIMVQDDVLPTDTALIFGIRDWRSQDPMLTERAYRAAVLVSPTLKENGLDEYNMMMREVRMPVAVALGARYFIFPTGADPRYSADDDPDRPPLKRLAFKEGMGLWEAEGVPGFAYLSDYLWVVPDEAGAAHWLLRATWEKVRAFGAVVEAPEEAVANIKHEPEAGSPGSTMVREYTPGHIAVDVNASRPALLVVAESYYPGWKATLDGRPVEILRTNYLSQGVVVPQGTHRVVLSYEPDSFRYGAIISVLSIAGIAGMWAVGGYWRRRRAH